jgi:hypothetical protein
LLGSYLSRHRAVEGEVTDRLLEENFVPLSTVLVDRAAFECVGGFHESFRVACDYLFAIRLSLRHVCTGSRDSGGLQNPHPQFDGGFSAYLCREHPCF